MVYRATDLKRHCDVAVKVLRKELMGDPAFVKRFEHEARAVSRLDHPNIISMMDVGQDGDVRYIVMEYVPGYTLKQFIAQRGRVAPQEAINITLEILAAVNHAHKHHIIHRDLKPQNILLAEDVYKRQRIRRDAARTSAAGRLFRGRHCARRLLRWRGLFGRRIFRRYISYGRRSFAS